MPQANKQTVRTATRSDRVMKELTPEEMSVISNIQSLLQEITSMGAGTSAGQAGVAAGPSGGAGQVTMEEEEGGGAEGPGGANYHGPTFRPGSPAPSRVEGEEEEEEEDDKYPEGMQAAPANAAPAPVGSTAPSRAVKTTAKKAIIVGDPDASTGSSDAEERVEDIPEWDEENVDEVAKAILRMALGKNIRKSAQPQNPLVALMTQVTKAIQSIADKQNAHERVLTDVLEGLGVAKQLEEAQPRAARNRPVQSMPADNANVMKEFVNALLSVMKGGDKRNAFGMAETDVSQSDRVHKSMSELALGLSQAAGDLWDPNLPQG